VTLSAAAAVVAACDAIYVLYAYACLCLTSVFTYFFIVVFLYNVFREFSIWVVTVCIALFLLFPVILSFQ